MPSPSAKLAIMVSRHSAFYSPLIATIAAGFLEDAGLTAEYSILRPGQRSHELIRDGVVDIMQSAPSSNWKPMEQGIRPLPVHFALINRRDGFFLLGRRPDVPFAWKDLEGRKLLADHGGQPLAMLKYAAHVNGVDWLKIQVLDRGTPEEMSAAFRQGEGDYVHLQAPGPQLLDGGTIVSVGASMPEVAFSTLCCSREFLGGEAHRAFLAAYTKARDWVRTTAPEAIAAKELPFFPGVSVSALAEAIGCYQELGTWAGSSQITEDLYARALRVFEHSGQVSTRYPMSAVCL